MKRHKIDLRQSPVDRRWRAWAVVPIIEDCVRTHRWCVVAVSKFRREALEKGLAVLRGLRK